MRRIASNKIGMALIWPACLVGGVLLLPACQEPEPAPMAYTGPTLESESLGLTDLPLPDDGYELLEQVRTEGRFPGAMAIIRLVPPQPYFGRRGTEPAIYREWSVGTIRWEEAIAWNALCNTIPQIREIIVMDQHNMVEPVVSIERILTSARRCEAALCLIYGPSPAEPDCAGLWGMVLDTATGQKVASIRAQAGPDDYEAPYSDAPKNDMRHFDPNYLVEVQFQQQTRACLLQLIGQDTPPAATQPSPWRNEAAPVQPIYVVPERSDR